MTSVYSLKTRVRDMRATVAQMTNSDNYQLGLSFHEYMEDQHHMKGRPRPRNRLERLATELAWLEWMMNKAEGLTNASAGEMKALRQPSVRI